MNAPIAALLLAAAACYASSDDLAEHFGTSTPYRPGDQHPVRAPDNYTVVGLSSIGRHGSRYPTAGKIKGFKKLQAFLAANSNVLTKRWMRGWTPDYDAAYDGVLWKRGASELMGIGERIAEYYGDVITPYNPNTVVSTCTYSGVAFGLGALGVSEFKSSPWAVNEDTAGRELRFFENCAAYVNGVDENETTYAPLRAYQASVYDRIAPKIAPQTGLSIEQLKQADRIETMWNLCVWDTLVHGDSDDDDDDDKRGDKKKGNKSEWCGLFDAEDAEAMELADDIEKHLQCGYGVRLSHRVAAPLLQAIVRHLDDLAAGRTGVRARLRFAHAETVMPLLALLGLYRDDVPLTSMTPAQRQARLWRTSRISPMATNVFFVLATAADGREPLVQVLHNEAPVALRPAGCSRAWCPLSAIKAAYADALATDFDKLCAW
eukprot:m51a1_g10652 hypothetical protein (433) ;mRNA; f:48726-50168